MSRMQTQLLRFFLYIYMFPGPISLPQRHCNHATCHGQERESYRSGLFRRPDVWRRIFRELQGRQILDDEWICHGLDWWGCKGLSCVLRVPWTKAVRGFTLPDQFPNEYAKRRNDSSRHRSQGMQ